MNPNTEGMDVQGKQEELNLPWTYQENSDAYTHILRGPTNGYILQGRQFSDGSEERKIRFIAEACNNYHSLKQQLSSLQEENERLKDALTWYADSDNYLHNDDTLASAWSMNKNIELKAKKALNQTTETR
jgi:hypothetical protein